MMNKSDYYKVLGIEPGTDLEEIKKVYRRLVLKYHPDKNKSPGARERFNEIINAYKYIINHYSENEEHQNYQEKASNVHNQSTPNGNNSPHRKKPKEYSSTITNWVFASIIVSITVVFLVFFISAHGNTTYQNDTYNNAYYSNNWQSNQVIIEKKFENIQNTHHDLTQKIKVSYQQELAKIDYESLFNINRIKIDSDLSESKLIASRGLVIVKKYRQQAEELYNETLQKFRKECTNINDLSIKHKYELMIKQMENINPIESWKYEELVAKECQKLILYLEVTLGEWEIINNKFYFSNNEHLVQFNKHIQKIQFYSEQQKKILSKIKDL